MSVIESTDSLIQNQQFTKSLIENNPESKEEDVPYDPNNAIDQEQAVKDANDDVYDNEYDAEQKDGDDQLEKDVKYKMEQEIEEVEEDEETIINSEHFAKEFLEAIESVQVAALFDSEILLNRIHSAYKQETGEQATNQMIVEALKSFTKNDEDTDNEQESEENEVEQGADIDPEEFEKEMNLALDNVRELGSKHQEIIIDIISETFAEINNGAEPTINDISTIFARIKQNFADEAAEDFLNENQSVDYDDSDDSDYDELDMAEIDQFRKDQNEDFEDNTDEYDDEDDSDYDPENEEDQEQAVIDFNDDIYNKQEDDENIETDQEEEDDEDTIINSEYFSNQFFEAIESVQIAAKYDQQQIFENVYEAFKEETGDYPTDDMLCDAFKTFNIIQQNDNDNDMDQDNDEFDIDPQEFEEELNLALENVRKLGQIHQKELVNKISDIYTEYNSDEPTINELSSIFDRIKRQFAIEAAQDFINKNQVQDDDEDSDYDESSDDYDYDEDNQ